MSGNGSWREWGKTRTRTITQRGRAPRDGLGIGEAYIRLCSIYPWVKDNIFILVPTTILRIRSTVAYDALFIFPLRTRDIRQSTFLVANSNTLFEKIMWQKYWYSFFGAGNRQYFRVLFCKPQARIRNVYLRRLGRWVNQHAQRIFSNSYIAIAYLLLFSSKLARPIKMKSSRICARIYTQYINYNITNPTLHDIKTLLNSISAIKWNKMYNLITENTHYPPFDIYVVIYISRLCAIIHFE